MADIARLNILADHLDAIAVAKKPKRFFDISGWIERLDPKQRAKHGCGMSACAGGEATYIRFFQHEGLKRSSDGKPEFNESIGYDALASFFRISRAASVSLFSPDAYAKPMRRVTPRDVSQRIRTYLALASHGGTI